MTQNSESAENHNPWTTLKETPVYENPWIQVSHNDVLNPSGKPGIYGVVRFKNKAIGIVPIDAEGNTWLVGQYRYSLKEYSWEIPMGGSPNEQSTLVGAQRELEEETGLTAAKWTLVSRLHTSNSVTDEEGFVFLAEELTQGPTKFDETEDLKIKKLPFKEALQMCLDNRITDCISVSGLLQVAAKKGITPY